MELVGKHERKARLEGRVEGRAEGEVRGLTMAITSMIEGRFGGVPEAVRLSLAGVVDSEALAQVVYPIGQADSLEAVEPIIEGVEAAPRRSTQRGRTQGRPRTRVGPSA